jgi:hypothetical protein
LLFDETFILWTLLAWQSLPRDNRF